MVEIEVGVLRNQCLDRRTDGPKRLRQEITVCERKRNAARSRIKWMFTRLFRHFQRVIITVMRY